MTLNMIETAQDGRDVPMFLSHFECFNTSSTAILESFISKVQAKEKMESSIAFEQN